MKNLQTSDLLYTKHGRVRNHNEECKLPKCLPPKRGSPDEQKEIRGDLSGVDVGALTTYKENMVNNGDLYNH